MKRGACSILLFLASSMLALPLAISTREVVNFDFAWRFKVYPQLQCSADSFLYNVTDLKCYGLNVIRASTADLCRDACCAQATCEIWQFTYGHGLPCEVGVSNNCTTTKQKIVGERREKGIDPSPKATNTPETNKDYDDSSWDVVDVPHDSIIIQPYHQSNELLEAFLPKNLTWYRKHFNLPLEWKGMSIWLYFEGVFRASSVYLNGYYLKFHDSGYTSFYVRLDNASNVTYGDGKSNENVLAVRCLANGNYGWWYEGGGIYRHVKLIAMNKGHIVSDSVYSVANITGSIAPHIKDDLSKGVFANVTFNLQVTVTNDNTSGNPLIGSVSFIILDQNQHRVSMIDFTKLNVSAQNSVPVSVEFNVKNIEVWSNLRPYLYTLQVELSSGSVVIDTVNTTIGARDFKWHPKTGYSLNGIHFVWRGFNNHNQFTGVGVGVSDRINLFQAQSMRAIGGNARRMSYNPPAPGLMDILDRLGTIVWDETRVFGKTDEWIEDFRSMVKRDRNHPSVMVWSICSGVECKVNDWYNISQVFKSVSIEEDPTRPVSANMLASNDSTPLDVLGLSHASGLNFDAIHKLFPAKPIIGSECCSCQSQRGEDDRSPKAFGGFNANCIQAQTAFQLSRSFVAGCMVYSLFDHYGEVTGIRWPHVSSSFGAFDIAGFPKASAYWYRTWWLLNAQKIPATKNDVPINPPLLVNPAINPSAEDTTGGFLIHIVQHWDERPNAMKHSIHVYTNAPQAELEVNGESKGVKQITSHGWGQWNDIIFIPGTLKAFALNVRGDVVATHTIETAGIPRTVTVGVDIPSKSTGTGSALVLDGQDTGMIHAAIVDSNGNVVNSASHNVTFKIVSGPGRIIGVGNGNPACHEPNQATWRSAYHGLARAIIQVTKDQSSSLLHRKRLMQIDSDGGIRTIIVPPGFEEPLEDIIIEASVKGLGSTQVSIPVSTDAEKDGVLNVAER